MTTVFLAVALGIIVSPAAALILPAFVSGAYLSAVTWRRITLTRAAMRRREREPIPAVAHKNLLILIPARNEQDAIGGCLKSLTHLNWPADKRRVIVIDHASNDDTGDIARVFAEKRPGHAVVPCEDGGGKGAALNAGLAAARADGFEPAYIYVLDADARVAPDAAAWLSRAMDAPGVFAAQGSMHVRNAGASLAATYASIEALVHQGITLCGASRLGRVVSLLGSNDLVSARWIDGHGGFPQDTRLEDVEMTLAIHDGGGRVAFEPRSVATIEAARRATSAFGQHRAWGRGFLDAAARADAKADDFASGERAERHSLAFRLDRALFELGYLDRPALLVFAACAAWASVAYETHALWIALVAYLLVPAYQILAALWRYQRPLADYLKLPLLPFAFAFDLLAQSLALVDFFRGGKAAWRRTRR
ncbi:glycosyltransferase family 2 protein [bacterium]|nr:glycosyltransferase family 2 protein [bacterium]